MDKLNSINLFVQAARYRSFSEVARHTGMSPSSVSRAIQQLEENLNTRLFNRTTRKITLTEAGAAFYERCDRILAELEEAELELSHSRSHPSGTLRLDLNMSLGRLHIVPALPQLLKSYPDLKLDVSLNDRTVNLVESGIDAVVRIGSIPDSRLMMRRLATVRYVACAAPEYLNHHGIPQTPQDLLQHNCINFVYPQTRRVFEWVFNINKQTLRLPVKGNLNLDHPEAHVEAAIAGAGIIQELKFIVAPAIAQGKLVPILEAYASVGEPITILYPQKRYLSAKVRVFLDFMQELIAKLKDSDIVE